MRHTAAGGDDPLSERTTVAAPLEHGVRASVGRHEAEAAAHYQAAVHLRQQHQRQAPHDDSPARPASGAGSPARSPEMEAAGAPPPMSAAVAAAFAAGGAAPGSRRPTDAGRPAAAAWGTGGSHHRSAAQASGAAHTHTHTTTTAPPQTGPPVVRMGRREAWARFLAYEAAWQVCLRSAGERAPGAAPFLADGCAALRKAFGFTGLLLAPAGPDGAPAAGGGGALAWDDSEAAVLPAVGFKPEVTRTAAIKVALSRVAAADLRARARAHASAAVGGGGGGGGGGLGGLGGLLGGGRPTDHLDASSIPVSATLAAGTGLAVCLRPTSWSAAGGNEAAVADVTGDGRAPGGDVLELGPGDMRGDLLVEVRSGGGGGPVVASGLVPVGDVWSAAGAGSGSGGPAAGDGAPGDDTDRERRAAGGPASKGGKLLGLLARAAGGHGAHAAAPSAGDGGAGKKWVTLYDPDGARYGHACLAAWICTQETTVIAAAAIRGDRVAAAAGPSGAGLGAAHGPGGGGLLRVTPAQVYDVALAAALRAQGCGPRRLAVTGEWAWLLGCLAASYGVRPSYAALAHAKWAVTRANATPTAYCLSLLGAVLGPLKAAQGRGALLPQELAMLGAVEREAVALLAATLEAYHSLSEAAPGGVLEGGGAAPEVPPPALLPAVELAGTLREGLRPNAVSWLAARFRAAAARRYAALETGCEAAAAPFAARAGGGGPDGSGDARHRPDPSHAGGVTSADADAYARLEALASAIQAELGSDLAIHDAAVLPSFINLPQVCAAEYGREYAAKLSSVLAAHPPPEPSPPAVDLLVAVGRQQEFLAWHNLAPPAGHPGALDALAVFGPHVGAWIDRSRRGLVARCRELEATTVATAPAAVVMGGPGGPGDHHHPGGGGSGGGGGGDGRACAAPLVEEVLALTGAEVGRYERVVTYWPLFAPAVEGAACAALREATAAVSRQCGLTQVPDGGGGGGGPPPLPGSRTASRALSGEEGWGAASSPGRWKWRAAPPAAGAARLTVAPHEAVLLNSLRRLLVVAPAMERLLDGWARGGGEDGGGGEGGASGPPSRATSPGRHATASPPPRGGRAAAAAAARAGDDPRAGPALGAQLAQLVKELRCEYASSVTSTASRIARGVFSLPGRSVRRALEAHGSSGVPGASQQALGPSLEVLEEVLLGLARALEGRVYVAVGRGLWDHTACEVLSYVEGLQEGAVGPAPPGAPGGIGGGALAGVGGGTRDAWRGRQAAAACLDVVDNFFSAVLAGTLAHDLSGRDLDLPASSARAHRLLDRNTDAATASYTVF